MSNLENSSNRLPYPDGPRTGRHTKMGGMPVDSLSPSPPQHDHSHSNRFSSAELIGQAYKPRDGWEYKPSHLYHNLTHSPRYPHAHNHEKGVIEVYSPEYEEPNTLAYAHQRPYTPPPPQHKASTSLGSLDSLPSAPSTPRTSFSTRDDNMLPSTSTMYSVTAPHTPGSSSVSTPTSSSASSSSSSSPSLSSSNRELSKSRSWRAHDVSRPPKRTFKTGPIRQQAAPLPPPTTTNVPSRSPLPPPRRVEPAEVVSQGSGHDIHEIEVDEYARNLQKQERERYEAETRLHQERQQRIREEQHQKWKEYRPTQDEQVPYGRALAKDVITYLRHRHGIYLKKRNSWTMGMFFNRHHGFLYMAIWDGVVDYERKDVIEFSSYDEATFEEWLSAQSDWSLSGHDEGPEFFQHGRITRSILEDAILHDRGETHWSELMPYYQQNKLASRLVGSSIYSRPNSAPRY